MTAPDGARAQGGAALRLDDAAVVYSDVIHALRGVTIDVPGGSIVALLGANGAGKTTVLRTVTGLLPMHRGKMLRGTITLDGTSVARTGAVDRVRAGVAQVMEGRRIFAPLTVEENLRAGSFSRARSERAAVAERREHVLTLFPDLVPRLDHVAGYLSGGQQQMLAIGRALMAAPRLLVLDEPSLGLAPLLVQQIRDAIVAINGEGTTVLLVEQNARMALQIADRGIVLASGRVVLEGAAADLMADPAVQASYLGGTVGEALPSGVSDVLPEAVTDDPTPEAPA